MLDALHVGLERGAAGRAEPLAHIEIGGGLPRLAFLQAIGRLLLEAHATIEARVDARGGAIAAGELAGQARVAAGAQFGIGAVQFVAADTDVVLQVGAAECEVIAQVLLHVAAGRGTVESLRARLVVDFNGDGAAGQHGRADQAAVIEHAGDWPREQDAAFAVLDGVVHVAALRHARDDQSGRGVTHRE